MESTRGKTVKSITNISNVSSTHFVTHIRHQHRCSRVILRAVLWRWSFWIVSPIHLPYFFQCRTVQLEPRTPQYNRAQNFTEFRPSFKPNFNWISTELELNITLFISFLFVSVDLKWAQHQYCTAGGYSYVGDIVMLVPYSWWQF